MIEEFRHNALPVFHDRPVFHFAFAESDEIGPGDTPDDVEDWAWRVGSEDYDGPDGEEIFPVFLSTVDTTRVRALLLGAWQSEIAGDGLPEFVGALAKAADRFPALEALFVADIPRELSEVSWIHSYEPGELLAAFPGLRVLGLRGGRLLFEPFVHGKVEELVIQSGGLPPQTVRAVGRSSLPALTSLDLYLGTEEYGGLATAEDLAPILAGTAFPGLRHLGLRDAENADDLAAALAHAPVVARLESLALSLGALGDAGAAALLAGQPLTHLKRLDLHHHYLSEAMVERLFQALPTVDIDLSEQLEPEIDEDEEDADLRSYRYVAVSE